METENVKHKGTITVILVVSLLLLIRQDTEMGAQGNKHDTNQEYTDLVGNWNKEKDKKQDYYRVIIENNLFRPLGWQTPNREPKYVLIATLIESHGGKAKALLMDKRSNEAYYVKIGEKVQDATVEKIESKQVHLNISGKILTLKTPTIRFLNVRNANVLSSSSREKPEQSASMSAPAQSRENKINRNPMNWSGNVQKMIDRYRQATPEERHEINEKLRKKIKQTLIK